MVGFNSKKVIVVNNNLETTLLPYVSTPMFFEDALVSAAVKVDTGRKVKVRLVRGQQEYVFSLNKILLNNRKKLQNVSTNSHTHTKH